MTKAQAKKTDDTLSKVSLEETDLDNVAGGENAQHIPCEDTYNDGEWCWLNDSCIVVFIWYEDDNDEMEFDENDILRGFHITDPDIIEDLSDDNPITATPKKNPFEDLLGDY